MALTSRARNEELLLEILSQCTLTELRMMRIRINEKGLYLVISVLQATKQEVDDRKSINELVSVL